MVLKTNSFLSRRVRLRDSLTKPWSGSFSHNKTRIKTKQRFFISARRHFGFAYETTKYTPATRMVNLFYFDTVDRAAEITGEEKIVDYSVNLIYFK